LALVARRASPLGVLLAALACIGALEAAAPARAPAAAPAKAALYADTDLSYWAYLRVSRSGRSLSPRGSRIESHDCSFPDVHLGSRERRVRISRSGRFRFARRRGRLVFRISGRFTTNRRARVTFRILREPPGARSRGCEDSGRVRLTPARVGPTPFRDCRDHRATNVLSTPTGRVFWEDEWDHREGWIVVAHACLFSVNERFELGQDDDDDSDLFEFRLAGPYVAYGRVEAAGGAATVYVRDLRDGRKLRGGLDPNRPTYPGELFTGISDLELKENGSVAVIGSPLSGGGFEVWGYDSLGVRLLDSGNVSKESLELAGSTLSWVKDGAPRSAELS
jgi:hypothetical protein